MCVCVYVCGGKYKCVCPCVEAKGQPWVLIFLQELCTLFLGLSLAWSSLTRPDWPFNKLQDPSVSPFPELEVCVCVCVCLLVFQKSELSSASLQGKLLTNQVVFLALLVYIACFETVSQTEGNPSAPAS